MLPSAYVWLKGEGGDSQSCYQDAIASAVRSHDPFQVVEGSWFDPTSVARF